MKCSFRICIVTLFIKYGKIISIQIFFVGVAVYTQPTALLLMRDYIGTRIIGLSSFMSEHFTKPKQGNISFDSYRSFTKYLVECMGS